MSTFDYLTPSEAVVAAREEAPEYVSILGLRGADADYFMGREERTSAGILRKPGDPWRANGYLKHFRVITDVKYVHTPAEEETRERGESPTVEVSFADGGSVYLHRGDLLCVERPV